MSGRVVLVGAGPGDPDLLTLRAARELERAEVLLYDALISPVLLGRPPESCERIDVGKRGDGTRGVSQDEISALMIERARAGRYVVRLKGGDPFIFGRGAEEASALAEAGVPFEIVPGVSSAAAVPAYAGVPLTDRRYASSFAVVTGHRSDDLDVSHVNWEALAGAVETLVVLMGTSWLPEITRRLIDAGRSPSTPVAVIQSGTTGRQKTVLADLQSIAAEVSRASLRAPTTIVIGPVAALRERLSWYEQRPLFARRVLVLRASEQSTPLIEALATAGAETLHVPLLRFEAVPSLPLELDGFAWLALTSANAARFAAPLLRGRARIACIGQATADAVHAAGLSVDLLPEGAALPEVLAASMHAADPLTGQRVLVPRVVGAREAFPEALRALGAQVETREIYRNHVPAQAFEALRKTVADRLDAVLVTSPSTVRRMLEGLGVEDFLQLAARAVMVCIGPTTAEALREAGAEAILIAENARSDALVRALEEHYSRATEA